MRYFPPLALTIVTLLSVAARGDEEQKAPGQRVFYLGDERVVVLHFNVLIDGKPAPSVWDGFLDRRFDALDVDKDGALTGDEIKGIPSQALLRQMGMGLQIVAAPQGTNLAPDHNPTDGKVSHKEFVEYYRRNGFESFRVRLDAANTSVLRVDAAAGRRQGPDESPRVLFEKLDSDGDGALTADDFRNAQHSLRKLDLDRDELISTNELVQLANLFQVAQPVNPNAEPSKPKFLALSSGQSPRALAQQLLSARDGHRGAAKDNRLSFEELGLPAEKLQSFDADGDGSLDFEETQQLLSDPPSDVELIVRLGKREPGSKGMELAGSPENRGTSETATFTLGTIQMEFALGDVGYSDSRVRAASMEESIGRTFKTADADNNGYLEASEAPRLGINPQTFALLDADKDGKLFLKEYTDFYLPMAEMEQSRVVLDVADRGRDLFRILDTNGDSRLGPREFSAAVERMSGWDRDGDGKVAQNEIAQQFRLVVGRGTVNPTGRVIVATPATRPVAMPRPAVAGGPAWFIKMDRNGDGDVSAREFLGPAELFAKFDTDSNGLLDVQEASAAEKSSR